MKGRYPMKKTITLGLMMLGLFAASVQARTKHCHKIEDCQELKAEVEADLWELLKDVTPELTGAWKKHVSSQYQAERECLNMHMRLPTAREFALFARSLGAQGISETKKDGYYLVKGTDSAGNPDHFYFSNKGYKRPAEDDGAVFFWTSTVHSVDSRYAYSFNGYTGTFQDVHTMILADGVRCAPSR